MRRNQRGMSLIEVLVSLAIVSTIIAMSVTLVSSAARSTRDNVNRQFATQKAISMLEELRGLIQTQNGSTTIVLDDYDNGTVNVPLLTTHAGITDPADPASGNRKVPGGSWLYSRRISVQKIKGAKDLRLVNVKVFVQERDGPRMLAEVAGVLSTIGQNTPPTQVYDVYLIAVENVPGWWLYMQNIVPFVEGAMQDLEARHPGLQFRQHWIRKLSYGRDPYYRPYVNEAQDSTADIPSVYFYPGKLPEGSAVENYYPPDFFNGQIAVDGVPVNGFDATLNPNPYTLADQYNHGMRYEDERALFEARVASGQESADAPTFRLLLDDMILRPRRYRNAIVINLHGELFPFPPVRNYSDAAKDPAVRPYVRAVTHPERLRSTNADALHLRVYSYHTNVTTPAAVPDWLGKGGAPVPITVTVRNVKWTPASTEIVAITGGVDFDNDTVADDYEAGSASPLASAQEMWWSSVISGNDTIIRLYNSPLKSPCATVTNPCDRGGLDPSKRLYALEYIPSPVEDLATTVAGAFETNLADTGTGVKNTARWVLSIPAGALPANDVVTIETRIGDDAPAPSNLSRTYVWRGTDLWLFGDATNDGHLPMTERFQFIGDPRHCPYADSKLPHLGSGLARQDALGLGYNRYFDDFHSAVNARAAWPGWSYMSAGGDWFGIKNNGGGSAGDDGWDSRSGTIELDVSRIFQVLRSAVTRTHAVYTTMTGYSYYYVGIGGEIGYDLANGFPNSIPVSSLPFTGVSGSLFEQSIIDNGVKVVRESAPAANYWWSMAWLGELAPDSAWNSWIATGNLPAGNIAGRFTRVQRGTINSRLPDGTALTNAVRRPQQEGSTAFFWSGTAASTFHHRGLDGTDGNRAADGDVIADTYKLPLPPTIANSRPFALNINSTNENPDHFLQNAYGTPTTLATEAEFYRHSTNILGSALLSMRNGNDTAFVVVNGLSPTGESGSAFIARWSFLSLVQSFMEAGRFSPGGVPHASRVRELPRVEITYPNDDVDIDDPASLNVQWQPTWKRWDGLPYTPSYPDNFTEDTTIRYAVLYSRDNGRTWLYMKDDQPATAGVRPDDAGYLQTAASFNWSLPAARFPRGNYLIRIEAYRDEVPLHYAFHQYRAFIKR
jgi:prepilin-type N-terminal cleavage/methylation domain-containing protein